jgi:hypothetical protein
MDTTLLYIGDELNAKESDDFFFDLDEDVDLAFPAGLIIYATNIHFQKNRVALNGNFLGHLKINQKGHIFEVDNSIHGKLKKGKNKITIVSCDRWGDRKSVANENIDDIHIENIDVCYKPK